MGSATITVLYQDGSPAANMQVEIKWYEGFWGIGQPNPDIKGTTNPTGVVVLPGTPSNTTLTGTINSQYGDASNFEVMTDASGNVRSVQTVYWSPVQSVANTLNVYGQKIGGNIFFYVIIGVIIVVVIIIIKKVSATNPLAAAASLFGKLRERVGY